MQYIIRNFGFGGGNPKLFNTISAAEKEAAKQVADMGNDYLDIYSVKVKKGTLVYDKKVSRVKLETKSTNWLERMSLSYKTRRRRTR